LCLEDDDSTTAPRTNSSTTTQTTTPTNTVDVTIDADALNLQVVKEHLGRTCGTDTSQPIYAACAASIDVVATANEASNREQEQVAAAVQRACSDPAVTGVRVTVAQRSGNEDFGEVPCP
jgi:hypothetical protein